MTTTAYGLPACECLAKWLPVYEAALRRRGALEGPLRVFQLIGDAPASGGVHREGGAFDITDLEGNLDVELARAMGADATWRRAAGFTTIHLHGVLTGCPHNGPARYQIDAVRAGFNGLGTNGRGGPDDGPRPLSGRTWQEGIQWEQENELMATAEEKIDARIEAAIPKIVEAVLDAKVDNDPKLTVRQAVRRAGRPLDEVATAIAAKVKEALR